jgi:hypothetical protein
VRTQQYRLRPIVIDAEMSRLRTQIKSALGGRRQFVGFDRQALCDDLIDAEVRKLGEQTGGGSHRRGMFVDVLLLSIVKPHQSLDCFDYALGVTNEIAVSIRRV